MLSPRITLALLSIFTISSVSAQEREPRLIVEPGAFKTLVNPQCSHCVDEAKRRVNDLKPNDRSLCWIRGYSDGGVIPYRFFLNPYRVISDTYGVFVYDPDAGFARGFAPSLDFTFHGWRNGVMMMKHKDGTLYSCLTGVAFDGPKKGDKLKPVATLVSDWGHWHDTYPHAVAYNMFEKYKPIELPTQAHAGSVKSRGPVDKRLAAEDMVFGVSERDQARAYPIERLLKERLIHDQIDGKPCAVLWLENTKSAAAYRPIASPPVKTNAKPRHVTLEHVHYAEKPFTDTEKRIFARSHPKAQWFNRVAPFRDKETGSHWDIAGRAVDGDLKGWTLEWLDGIQVKWFAWAAEHPRTTIYAEKKHDAPKPNPKKAIEEIAGTAEFLRAVPKKFGILQNADSTKRTVNIKFEGDKEPTTWALTPDAEIKVLGWWGRLDDLTSRPNQNRLVWAWFKVDRTKRPVAIFMVADDLSEQDIHGDGWTLKAVEEKTLVFTTGKERKRESLISECTYFRDNKSAKLEELKLNDRVFVVRYSFPLLPKRNVGDPPAKEGDGLERERYETHILDRASFERYRTKQKKHQRDRWIYEGLPGSTGFLHVYAGEVDVILDHEAMRWGRSLLAGDKVELIAPSSLGGRGVWGDGDSPIKAVVKSVTAQREKTQVRLVARTFDLADLAMGQRILLKMPAPSAAIENAIMPPGIDLPKAKDERIEWFLANTYCTCKIGGDGCTGHFYTLASCNPNGCGAPKQMRQYVGKKIDDGWTNREIFEALLKEKGQPLLRPHLLP